MRLWDNRTATPTRCAVESCSDSWAAKLTRIPAAEASTAWGREHGGLVAQPQGGPCDFQKGWLSEAMAALHLADTGWPHCARGTAGPGLGAPVPLCVRLSPGGRVVPCRHV